MKDLVSGFNPVDNGFSSVDYSDDRYLGQNQTAGEYNVLKAAATTVAAASGENVNRSCNDPQTIEEKFKIDRKKLEAMLKGENDVDETAEMFFQRVMDETRAIIIWPSKLKIGAKSKKDPHVKVIGLPNQVRLAKEKIMANLDVKRSKICLKIDVAYPDHSHLIGKRGDNIQHIMGLTRCQIHFPDSNRNNSTEKSNQVSISGQPDDVESARDMIRQSLPLTLTFDSLCSIRSDYSMTVEEVKERFSILVQVKVPQPSRIMGSNNKILVIVRGSEKHSHNVINGTKYLLENIVVSQMNEIHATIILDIAPQHHESVQTHCRVNGLERLTGTEIIFPNVESRGPSIEKSPVRIIGSVIGVCNARKAILNFLPALLSFDLPEDHPFCRFGSSAKEISKNEIVITMKSKPRDGRVPVSIKGAEGKISEMYDTRQQILNSNGEGLFSYSSSNAVPWNTRGFDHGHSLSMPNKSGSLSTLSIGTTETRMPESRRISSGGWNIGSSISLSLPESQSFESCVFPRTNSMHLQIGSDQGFYSGPSSAASSLSSPAQSPRFGTPNEFNLSTISESPPAFSYNGSASYSNVANVGQFGNEIQRTSTPSSFSIVEDATNPLNFLTESLEKISLYEALNPLREKNESLDLDNTLTDIAEKRLLANKAMQKRINKPELRIPNANWHGFGFSASMPSSESWRDQNHLHFEQNGSPSTETESKQDVPSWCNTHKDHSLLSPDNGFMKVHPKMNFAASNYLDSNLIPETALSKCTTVDEFLNVLGLLDYAGRFHQQEIDFPWFLQLNEKDLRELGIDKMGPRRKIALAIHKIKSMKAATCISPAIGAERKFMGFGN